MLIFENICIILLVNLVFYAKTLCYKYSSDDIPSFLNPIKTNSLWEKVYYWIEGRSRLGPQVDHALTLLIHSLVCVGIYLAFGTNQVSFIGALLFSLNPANNQVSVWISGRSYALATLGMTYALAFPILCLPFILLATSTNPGFIAPLALLGSKYYWMILVALVAWAFHWKRFSGNVKQKMEKEMFVEDKKINIRKVVLALKTFGFYTTLALIPFKNTFYHSFLQSAAGCGKEKAYTTKDRFFWLGLIYACLIIIYFTCFTWNIVSFGLLWWCICIAPFCNFMRLSQEIAERYMYLPNAGLMIALASVLSPTLAYMFMTMYAVKMWFYMDCYQDDYYLLETACLNSPQSWFAWHVRGMKRWESQSHQEALIIWTMARMISPLEYKINFNIATALKMGRKDKEALEFMKIAMDNVPQGQEDAAFKLHEDWKQGKMAILL